MVLVTNYSLILYPGKHQSWMSGSAENGLLSFSPGVLESHYELIRIGTSNLSAIPGLILFWSVGA
jgi:hypothetical protein